MRYWNPRRAAALRIVIDARAAFQKEEFDQVLGLISGSSSFDQAFASFSQEVSAGGGKGVPALFASLTGLRSSNRSIFQMVLEEISKSQSGPAKKGGVQK